MVSLSEIGCVGPISSLYRSAPRERSDQPDFLNAAVAVITELEPRPLLVELKAIERRLGRDPFGRRYGPRLVDLDLLAIEGRCIDDDPDLVVPHRAWPSGGSRSNRSPSWTSNCGRGPSALGTGAT